MKVLVAVASRHGSTAEIAQTIGEQLRSDGHDVVVAAPEEVVTLARTEAMVLGSALYVGHWEPAAVRLAERAGAELDGRPVWLFSSGPVGRPEGKFTRQMAVDPAELPKVLAQTKALGHRIFPGKLDRYQLHGLQRAALGVFRGMEGDFRDWTAVRSWADGISAQLGRRASH